MEDGASGSIISESRTSGSVLIEPRHALAEMLADFSRLLPRSRGSRSLATLRPTLARALSTALACHCHARFDGFLFYCHHVLRPTTRIRASDTLSRCCPARIAAGLCTGASLRPRMHSVFALPQLARTRSLSLLLICSRLHSP